MDKACFRNMVICHIVVQFLLLALPLTGHRSLFLITHDLCVICVLMETEKKCTNSLVISYNVDQSFLPTWLNYGLGEASDHRSPKIYNLTLDMQAVIV